MRSKDMWLKLTETFHSVYVCIGYNLHIKKKQKLQKINQSEMKNFR